MEIITDEEYDELEKKDKLYSCLSKHHVNRKNGNLWFFRPWTNVPFHFIKECSILEGAKEYVILDERLHKKKINSADETNYHLKQYFTRNLIKLYKSYAMNYVHSFISCCVDNDKMTELIKNSVYNGDRKLLSKIGVPEFVFSLKNKSLSDVRNKLSHVEIHQKSSKMVVNNFSSDQIKFIQNAFKSKKNVFNVDKSMRNIMKKIYHGEKIRLSDSLANISDVFEVRVNLEYLRKNKKFFPESYRFLNKKMKSP